MLPKNLKRTRDVFEDKRALPTPIATSSTHILSSSPGAKSVARNLFKGTERVPLGALPTIRVKEDGTATKLGRSSQACDYQLSANRLISRVHVEVTYIQSLSRLNVERIEVHCIGWNGAKLHCKNKMYELKRGSTFSTDMRDEEIMLDIHGSRVILEWPDKPRLGPASEDEDELDLSPAKKLRPMRRHSTPPSPSPNHFRKPRPVLPMSPSPSSQVLPSSPPVISAHEAPPVEIFEDPETAEPEDGNVKSEGTSVTAPTSTKTEQESFTSVSSLSSAQDFSDADEENDPIIYSFGPGGANLLSRMQAVNSGSSPVRSAAAKPPRLPHSEPLKPISSPVQPRSRFTDSDIDIRGHVINQLAYSRLSALPLSTIISHLPLAAQSISEAELKQVIYGIPCVGEVTREGKDAAGKALENEFYYIPDKDDDVNRQQAVVNDLRKPSLRACRKQHKVRV